MRNTLRVLPALRALQAAIAYTKSRLAAMEHDRAWTDDTRVRA
jgi:hypothetical protein